MAKIATKTKLLKYAVEEGKESLVLDVCDFSDGQVESLERCVRYPEDTVMMTIATETDKLDIAPMEFRVKIGPVQLQRKGQKVPLTEFNGRTEHAVKLRKLTKAGTIVIVTFEQIRKQMMLGEAATGDVTIKQKSYDGVETRQVKVPASWKASAKVEMYIDGDGRHRSRITVVIPKIAEPCLKVSDGEETPDEALWSAMGQVQDWLSEQTQYGKREVLEAKIVDLCTVWAKELAPAKDEGKA